MPAACTACFKFIIGYNSPIVKKKNGKNGKQINFKNPEIGPTWPRNRCAGDIWLMDWSGDIPDGETVGVYHYVLRPHTEDI